MGWLLPGKIGFLATSAANWAMSLFSAMSCLASTSGSWGYELRDFLKLAVTILRLLGGVKHALFTELIVAGHHLYLGYWEYLTSTTIWMPGISSPACIFGGPVTLKPIIGWVVHSLASSPKVSQHV